MPVSGEHAVSEELPQQRPLPCNILGATELRLGQLNDRWERPFQQRHGFVLWRQGGEEVERRHDRVDNDIPEACVPQPRARALLQERPCDLQPARAVFCLGVVQKGEEDGHIKRPALLDELFLESSQRSGYTLVSIEIENMIGKCAYIRVIDRPSEHRDCVNVPRLPGLGLVFSEVFAASCVCGGEVGLSSGAGDALRAGAGEEGTEVGL